MTARQNQSNPAAAKTIAPSDDPSAGYVAFFDLDGTLLDTSSAKLFFLYLYQEKRINLKELMEGALIGAFHRLGLMNTEKRVKKWVAKYRGQSEQATIDDVQGWFERQVKAHIRPGLQAEIEWHRQRGGKLVILSAATEYVCRPVQAHLGLDDVICTRLAVKDGFFTGHIDGTYCFGREKPRRALAYCRDQGYSPRTAWYYGDALADSHIMKQIGTPVCVAPDWRLKRMARQNHWRIIDF